MTGRTFRNVERVGRSRSSSDDRATACYDPAAVQGRRFCAATADFRAGTDTPRAYLERCLETIADREPVVRAWVVLDETAAREGADASTERWRRGTPLSPIDGLPIGIKDLLETRDMPTGMGCAAFDGHFPRRDNAAVWALRQAGALVLGKTVTTELGGPEPGPTTNPFDPRRTPGGSSSGSAAAVGAAMVPAAIATQTGGSLMRPASFCGGWGLKPSQGAINRGERQTASQTTHGVIAACAHDMWTIAREIAARAGGDPGWPALSGPSTPPPPSRPVTLAVMEGEGWDRLDDASREAFEQVLARIAASDVTVLRRGDDAALERFERSLVGASGLGSAILAWEHFWAFHDIATDRPDGITPRGRAFFLDAATDLGPEGYEEALRDRAALRACYAHLRGRVDAIIAPTSTGPAPELAPAADGGSAARWPTGDPAFNFPSSMLGAPAVNVPLMAVAGLPFGLQIMGHPGDDARVTAVARWVADTVGPVVAHVAGHVLGVPRSF